MRKEVIIAILLGFAVGLFIAYGIYSANKAVKETKINQPTTSETSATSQPQASPTFQLTVSEPEDNIVLSDEEATVSGQTEPKTTVAILAEESEELLYADKQGLFSTTIELIGGLNVIKVIAVNKAGERQEKIINVIYSTAKID
ncbi:hypothetical protein ACFLZ1_01635 [Patescibacteria group bacterium]